MLILTLKLYYYLIDQTLLYSLWSYLRLGIEMLLVFSNSKKQKTNYVYVL